jgi:gliding motility-associated-like protein
MRKIIYLSGVVVFILAPLVSLSQITSTFNADADGWTCSDVNLSGPLTITHNSTGGNPGGFTSVSTATSSLTFPNYFTSPSKFNGNISFLSYGQDLSFDIQLNHAANAHSPYGDILIRTPSGSWLAYNLPTFPAQAPAWSTHTVRLDESAGWRLGGTSGPLATKQDMLNYLSQVASIRINVHYRNLTTTAVGSIDNVVLNQRTLLPAPVVTSFTPTSAPVGTSVTITGNNFGATIANNAVYFGGVAAAITSASATQLVVTVPSGAQHGPITVINKTTGLSKLSAQPFNPTFSGGGRIIPASFKPRVDINLAAHNTNPHLRIADVDGDGWNDFLISALGNPAGIDVMRNKGLGGNITSSFFEASVRFTHTYSETTYLRIADLDGDGKMDAITSAYFGLFGGFVTFRNISTPGNIAYEAPESWNGKTDRSPPYNVVDLDGDGLPEMIGGHGNGGGGPNVWIAQNMSTPGDVQFGPSIFYFPEALDDAPSQATVGDLDNDGKPEIILTTGFQGAFTIFKNTSTPGQLSFTPLFTLAEGHNDAVLIADFNLDGKNDLAFAELFNGDDIQIRINTNTDATLDASDLATEIVLKSDLGYRAGGVIISDINGDGKPDIVATDDADIGFFENVFSGGVFDANAFVEAYQLEGGGNSTYPSYPIAADLNGDDKPDLVFKTTNTTPHRISIFENKNVHAPEISLTTVSPLKGAIGTTVTITGNNFSSVPTENKVWFGAVRANVLTATPTQLTVTVPAGASYAPVSVTKNELTSIYHLPFVPTFGAGVTFDNTKFSAPINFPLTAPDFYVEVGDMDNDGKPDIIADGNSGQTYSFRNTHSTGAISTSSLTADDVISSASPKLSDIDGDGLLDFFSSLGMVRNTSTVGNLSFAAVTPTEGVRNHSPADFNHDGKIDVAAAYGNNGAVAENRTTQGAFIAFSSFSDMMLLSKPAVNGGAAAADFDNDGWMDFVATNPGTDNVTVWKNNGAYRVTTTQFTTLPNIAVGDNPGRIYTGDLDLDGKMDLVMYYEQTTSSQFVTVLHNTSSTGNISFSRVDYAISSFATAAHISDLDGDGKPEIIVISFTGNRFLILKNTSSPGVMNSTSFAAPFLTTVNGPEGVATGDLNLDGKPEIIITAAPNSLLVYENLIAVTSIAINTQPTTATVCAGATPTFSTTATGTSNITFQWQYSTTLTGTYSDIANGSGYSNMATSTLSVNTTGNFGEGFYRCKVNGDNAATVFTNAVQLTVNAAPSAPTVIGASNCGPGSVVLGANGGAAGQYRWYDVATGGTAIVGQTNATFTTPSLTATTVFHVAINNGTCESARTAVTATINPVPSKPTITSSISLMGNALTICSTTTLTLSAPTGFTGYAWSNGATTQQITVSATGIYTVTVTSSGCTSAASDGVTITVVPAPCNNQPPTINSELILTTVGGVVTLNLLDLISDADGNLVASSLSIVEDPGSEAVANISNNVLTIDYSSITFSGNDAMRIRVCDTFGACTEHELQIQVAGEMIVYNALSPGNDGKNDIFYLQHIEFLPSTQRNKVTIFNRWGDVVFDVEDYNNDDKVFRGLSNDGKELPSGVYFYKIVFGSGEKGVDGFISLRR